jgi:hypothetical protein
VLWWPLLALTILITALSFLIQPHLSQSFAARPWGYGFPFLAILGLLGIRLLQGAWPFLCSSLYIIGMLTSAAFGPGLILREDFPERPQYLPRALSPEDDHELQEELRRTDNLYSNASLLTRLTGIRIGECIHLQSIVCATSDPSSGPCMCPSERCTPNAWCP